MKTNAITKSEEIPIKHVSQLERLEAVVHSGFSAFIVSGLALSKIHRLGLYSEQYGTWKHYLSARWGFSREHARKLMVAARIVEDELAPIGAVAGFVRHESQIRPLIELSSASDRQKVFQKAIEMAGKLPPTAIQVTDAVRRHQLLQHLAEQGSGKPLITIHSDENCRSLIVKGNSLDPIVLKEGSSHLICGSPPYNLGMDHPSHSDDLSQEVYSEQRDLWMRNCYLWSADGGRMALIVPVDVRRPSTAPLGTQFVNSAMKAGWIYSATIVWDEGSHNQWHLPVDPPAQPAITCPCELILIFAKGHLHRTNPGVEPDVTPDEYRDWMHGVWKIAGAHATRVGHPCPYPNEIPRRLIKMLTYPGEVVIDPWCGSGTTVIEAAKAGRKGFGVDIEESYCELARANLSKIQSIKPDGPIEVGT